MRTHSQDGKTVYLALALDFSRAMANCVLELWY